MSTTPPTHNTLDGSKEEDDDDSILDQEFAVEFHTPQASHTTASLLPPLKRSSASACSTRSSKRARPISILEPSPPQADNEAHVDFDPQLTDFVGEMERSNSIVPHSFSGAQESSCTSSLAVNAPLPISDGRTNGSPQTFVENHHTSTVMGCKFNSIVGEVYGFPIDEQQRMFSNQFHPVDTVMAKLHYECYKAGAPQFLPDKFISIVQEAHQQFGFDLSSPFLTKRDSLMARIKKTVGASAPTPTNVNLESGLKTVIYRFDLHQRLQDHLISSTFADYENLSIPTPPNNEDSPFGLATISSDSRVHNDLASFASGEWYRQATQMPHYKQKLDSGKYLLHPLVAYMDKTGVDKIEKISVEPVAVTSADLDQTSREKAENWVLLGYVPSLKWLRQQRSPTTTTNSRSMALRDYHHCLSILLEPLKTIQSEQPQSCSDVALM
ncbi:unnamed protein product [Cylindrotheca closterium]|uniref:Uncharacterized protein n=1 Tax=Cylindrotheca closterium TaxID=2856 RepID=A0AAD2FDE0_9STRA|nr:unnamed protein product [Cylindrotheca closterium]